MKKILTLISVGVLVGSLGMSCDDKTLGRQTGLGEEISGIETIQAAGVVIGSYSNGFGSILVQVDEEYPIGGTIEYTTSMPCATLPEAGTYQNVIQVQCVLAVDTGSEISFSAREFQGEDDRDSDMFIIGDGTGNELCMEPAVPIYVITNLTTSNNT